MPKILDVGCGINKRPGSIGIDRNANTAADAICDLGHFPYPSRTAIKRIGPSRSS